MKKHHITPLVLMLLGLGCLLFLTGQSGQLFSLIAANYTTAPTDFATGELSPSALNQIVSAARWSPSMNNNQPWHFTILADNSELAQLLIPDIKQGNIIVVVSADMSLSGSSFDCALATQNVYLAAQSLGLGARIYGSPVPAINQNYLELLQIPSGYQAVATVRIGNRTAVDAVTAVSSRKDVEDIVNYR
jgi:nitroreductase